MNELIEANVTKMFEMVEPAYVSGSAAELGDSVARITWTNALQIAERCERWLLSPVAESAELMRDWARSTGAWNKDEILGWSIEECLALFAQNVASEIRNCLDADENFDSISEKFDATNWDEESEYPIGNYYRAKRSDPQSDILVDFYVGV